MSPAPPRSQPRRRRLQCTEWKVEMVPSRRETTVNLKVAVVGGGPGEVSVAIAVARSGARSVLLERTAIFGGAAASGLGIHGLLDRSGTIALGALAQEFL